MTYFLDTNTCIYALKGTYDSIREHVQKRDPAQIKIPSIVKAELLLGAENSNSPEDTKEKAEKFLFPFTVVPFDDRAAPHYAAIRAGLEDRGAPIGPNDLLIAATVRSRNGTLVTHNTGEFERMEDLSLRDWTQP